MKGAGRVAVIREMRDVIKTPKGEDHFGDLRPGRIIIIKWTSKK
jgi:hypothetical protein